MTGLTQPVIVAKFPQAEKFSQPLPCRYIRSKRILPPLLPDRAKFFSRSSLVGAIAPPVPVIPVSVKSCLGRNEHPADKNGARAPGDVARTAPGAVGSHCQVWRRRKWKLSIRPKCGSSESHGWRIRGKKLKWQDGVAAISNLKRPRSSIG